MAKLLNTSFNNKYLGYLVRHWVQHPTRYALDRWVMPRLGVEPHTVRNLCQKAWPTVAALTSDNWDKSAYDCIEWDAAANSDGTTLLEEYARKSRPLLLKNYAFSHGIKPWTFDYVKEIAGEAIAKIRVGEYDSEFGDPEMVSMRLGHFVDYVVGKTKFPLPGREVNGLKPYMGNNRMPLLDKHLPVPRFVGDTPGTHYWMGSSARTPLHCHQQGDFFIQQLVGERTFILVPPHEALLVGFLPVNLNIGTATFNPFEGEANRSGSADKVHPIRIDLKPGDALLLPGFWFHAVQITGPSLSATSASNLMPAAIGGGSMQPWRERRWERGL